MDTDLTDLTEVELIQKVLKAFEPLRDAIKELRQESLRNQGTLSFYCGHPQYYGICGVDRVEHKKTPLEWDHSFISLKDKFADLPD